MDSNFEELKPPFDEGVARGFRATEDFIFQGEQVQRVTEIRFLTDGGIHIVQRVPKQNIYDSLTLSEAAAGRLCTGRGRDD